MRRLLVLLLLGGCSAQAPVQSQALLVGAPASLRAPFEAIAKAFLVRHPESPARLAFGSAAELARSGVALDVVAADVADGLTPVAERILAGVRRDYASNPLVLVTRAGAPPVRLAALPVTPFVEKLARADSRSDPSGKAAEAALGRLAIRRAMNDKLAYLATPVEVLAALAQGQVQAGLVFASDLAQAEGAEHRFTIADRLPDDPHARYPIAILSTPRLPAAR
jgi:molybdate transport system substrate-binding protein